MAQAALVAQGVGSLDVIPHRRSASATGRWIG